MAAREIKELMNVEGDKQSVVFLEMYTPTKTVFHYTE